MRVRNRIVRHGAANALALAALFVLAGCAKDPITLSPGFTPTSTLSNAPHRAHEADRTGVCRIHLSGVQDLRSDKESLGTIGVRDVHGADMVAWLRSGLQTLNRDKDIQIVDDSAQGDDLELSADLLKAYVLSITSDKSTTVVIRVHYSRNGAALGDQVYRGVSTGWNWANGEDETQSSFNDALDDLLKTLDGDIETRCNGMAGASPHVANVSMHAP